MKRFMASKKRKRKRMAELEQMFRQDYLARTGEEPKFVNVWWHETAFFENDKIPTAPPSSIYSCPCVPINSSSARRVHPRTKNRSSAAGVDLWWSANHRMKWFRATFLSPTRGTEGVVKTIERSGFLFFPEGRRPRWEVDPPLRVREDWWVFEDLLRFKEVLVVFRRFKNLLLVFWMSRNYF